METLGSAELMEAVEAALNRLYPGEPVYWDSLPKDFKRPCFALECPRTAGTDLNAALVRREADILVTCMVKTDAYGDSSRKELARRQSTVADLFAQGFLRVKGRAVKVSGAKGEQIPELATVTGLFSWAEGRPGATDPEVPYEPDNPAAPEGAKIPRMERFSINQGSAAGGGGAPEIQIEEEIFYERDNRPAQAENRL